MRTLKIIRCNGFRHGVQIQMFVATTTKKKACELMKSSPYFFSNHSNITGRSDKLLMDKPDVVFFIPVKYTNFLTAEHMNALIELSSITCFADMEKVMNDFEAKMQETRSR